MKIGRTSSDYANEFIELLINPPLFDKWKVKDKDPPAPFKARLRHRLFPTLTSDELEAHAETIRQSYEHYYRDNSPYIRIHVPVNTGRQRPLTAP